MNLDIDNLKLESGSHSNPESGMCVMEAVAMMSGEKFSDSPACASPVISAFLRNWNDNLPDAERQQLKKYIPLMIGTHGTSALEEKRAWMATDWLSRVQAPAWLDLVGLTSQANILRSMGEVTPKTALSIRPALKSVRVDAAAAWEAAWEAAWAATLDVVRGAARAATGAAAGDAAWAAAGAAGLDATRAIVRDAARAAAKKKLAPTVTELQIRAHELVMRMIEAKDE